MNLYVLRYKPEKAEKLDTDNSSREYASHRARVSLDPSEALRLGKMRGREASLNLGRTTPFDDKAGM